jgi:hypothetical protein
LTSPHSFLAQLEEGKPVRVAIAMHDTGEKERISCVYSQLDPPRFALTFLPRTLPTARIDQARTCLVLVDLAGQTVSLAAELESIVDDQTLHLIGREVVSHEQLRDFFRVDVTTPVEARCLINQDQDDTNTFRLTGETIDVSGSGLLANFDQPLAMDELVDLDLVLPPEGKESVQLTAKVVRIKRLGGNRFQIGLHFEQLSSEVHDKIMASCFKIQRDHLRLRVRIRQ